MVKIFGEDSFQKIEAIIIENLTSRLKNLTDEILLSDDIEIIIKNQSEKSELKKLTVNFVERSHETKLVTLKGRQLPNGFDVEPNENTNRAQVQYGFPIENGDIELLSVRPKNAYISSPILGQIISKKLFVYFQTTSQSVALDHETKNKVIARRDKSIAELKEAVSDINEMTIEFNKDLLSITRKKVISLVEAAKKRRDQDDELS